MWWSEARSAREDRGVLVSLMVDGTMVRTTDLVQAVVAEVVGIYAICGVRIKLHGGEVVVRARTSPLVRRR